jgi:hypothetical protein
VFPSLTDQIFQAAQFGTNYAQTSGVVVDSAPRTISLLVASQNDVVAAGADGILGTADDVFVSGNKAAFTSQQRALSFLGAGYQNLTLPGADGSTAPRMTPERPSPAWTVCWARPRSPPRLLTATARQPARRRISSPPTASKAPAQR